MLKDLKVYQLAAQLYKDIKRVSGLTGVEKNQLERAVMGSLRESQALLELLDSPELLRRADHVGALLYRFMQNPGGLQ